MRKDPQYAMNIADFLPSEQVIKDNDTLHYITMGIALKSYWSDKCQNNRFLFPPLLPHFEIRNLVLVGIIEVLAAHAPDKSVVARACSGVD